MYLCGEPSFGDEFQCGGERIVSYPAISLTHICVQELPENELAVVSATKECASAEPEDRVMETNSKAAVRED